MPKQKFLRRTFNRYPKLGKRRKKKQVWRRPTGRDNKMREKRKGYPSIVSIGYKKNKRLEKKIIVIRNIKDLDAIKKNETVIIGKIGRKKKIEIIKKLKENKIQVQNINVKKFLRKNREKENNKEKTGKEEKTSEKILKKDHAHEKTNDKKNTHHDTHRVKGEGKNESK